MKKLLLSITALALTTGIFAQEKTEEAPKKGADDVAKFKSETLDLGKITQDNPTAGVFEVTNISKEPLLIEQANPTCGCTISDYTKEPIAPGKSGTIKATYNAKNIGMFEKHLTVKFAGVEGMKSITIKGEVVKKEETAAAETPAPAAVAAEPKKEVVAEKAAPAAVKPAATTTAKKATPAKKAPAKKAAPATEAAPTKKP